MTKEHKEHKEHKKKSHRAKNRIKYKKHSKKSTKDRRCSSSSSSSSDDDDPKHQLERERAAVSGLRDFLYLYPSMRKELRDVSSAPGAIAADCQWQFAGSRLVFFTLDRK